MKAGAATGVRRRAAVGIGLLAAGLAGALLVLYRYLDAQAAGEMWLAIGGLVLALGLAALGGTALSSWSGRWGGNSRSPAARARGQLAKAIEGMNEGVALFDRDDRLVLCNDRFRQMFVDAEAPVAVGARFEDMLRVIAGKGLIAGIDDREEEWLRERVAQHRDPQGQIKQFLTDGRCLLVSEYRTDAGGIISIQTDITEFERREAVRRINEEKTLSIIEAVIDSVVTFDADGAIETFNPAAERIFDYTAADVLGGDMTTLMENADAEEHKALIAQYLDTGDAGVFGAMREIEGRRRDGSAFPLEIAVNEMRGTWTLHDRRRARRHVFIATMRDISRRRELAQQLQQSQKMEAIGTLAGGIAHDFNNIFSIILGYTSLVLDDHEGGRHSDDAELKDNLTTVIQAGRRARDLIEQILTFSRHAEQAKRPLVLQPIVQEVMKLMRSTLPSTIEIRQDLASEPATVLADPSQLHQVLMNVCTNGAHAMEEAGGVLEIVLDRTAVDDTANAAGELSPGSYVRLMVRDTGSGMDQATMERIFEPFFTTKGVGRGTGLGLSVAHGIVTNYGGAIRADSALGQGTRFELLLPYYAAEVGEVEGEAAPSAPVGKGRILFVDDEAALVRMAEKVLTRLGYSVVGETGSRAALEVFRENPTGFDLIVTDQTMPGMTGDALLGEIRKLRTDIPVLLCTGFNHRLSPERAREMGLDGYLMKPVLAHELGQAVGRALQSRPV